MAIDEQKTIEFYSIKDFEGMKFFIPDYQRGYRWTESEVTDLLDDISAFQKKYPGKSYSLQPIVVKKLDNEQWEVVDGQQRLTTVLIIMQALGIKNYYSIKYAVLENSSKYIGHLPERTLNDDINIFHMNKAYDTIIEWIHKNDNEGGTHEESEPSQEEKVKVLVNFVQENLKFLWYRTDLVDDADGEKIFRRLNIGKIELTQAELIKALFLAKDNFNGPVNRREEIARQWDLYEAYLQDDEFWLFLTNEKDNSSPTRIEFILRFLVEAYHKMFDNYDQDELNSRDGLFRAYYAIYAKDKEAFMRLWDKAIETMDVWRIWCDDVILYHLVGFMLFNCPARGKQYSLKNLTEQWHSRTVTGFVCDYVHKEITAVIKDFDPNRCYLEGEAEKKKDNKRQAYPYLLLMNVLYVLKQNISHIQNQDYRQGIFYKFPFHLLKKAIKGAGKGWDVEHIDSATANDLNDEKDRQDWILSIFMSLPDEKKSEIEEIKLDSQDSSDASNNAGPSLIRAFFEGLTNETNDSEKIWERLVEIMTPLVNSSNPIKDKNLISNYALLDYNTNRSYKNAIYPTKRLHIRDKEEGRLRYFIWDKETHSIKERQEDKKQSFVPPCTKDAFMKTFSNTPGNMLNWTQSDANSYLERMEGLFEWFKEFEWRKVILS